MILSGDIKLVASRVMDDVPEGGGDPTTTVIADGTSNSIFNDISEVDRAAGRVNLRKVFVNVQTDNRDTYLGANVIVADAPDDPLVSVTMFEATGTFDERTDAAERIEAYLNKAALWDGYLFENHIAGQRSIQIFHRDEVKPPVVGKTLCLIANEGLPAEYLQYIRVIDVESETRTFTFNSGSGPVDYSATISTCTLSDALAHDFPGSPANRYFTQAANKSVLRDTLVADAAKYYGASETTAPITLGASKGNVESVYTKIVPSAQTETALVDRPMVGGSVPMVASANAALTRTVNTTIAPNGRYVFPTGVYPGSVSLGGTITDDGIGNVLFNTVIVGSIDYNTGEIDFNSSGPSLSGNIVETYRPAAGVSMQQHTTSRAVTASNRAYVWVTPLSPIPAPGSLVVSYMALGNWYELKDDGSGVLRGSDPAYGTGTVSFTTGTANLTLGALPDVGSEVMHAWGTPQEFVVATESSLAIEPPKIEFDVGGPIAPGSLEITWPTGKVATDNGNGTIAGDGDGEVYYGTGKGWFIADTLPGSANVSIDYDTGSSEVYGVTVGAGVSWSGTLPNAPIKPKSLVINLQMQQSGASPDGYGQVATSSKVIPAVVRDNGSGGLVLDGFGPLSGSSINYTTGAVVLAINEAASIPMAQYTMPPTYRDLGNWNVIYFPETVPVISGYLNSVITRSIAAGAISAFYQRASTTNTPATTASVTPSFTLDLMPYLRGAVVEGSLRFKLGDRLYSDRDGVLYHSINPSTGSGTPAGTVNYATGKAAITSWPAGTPTFTLESGLINPGKVGVSWVTGRVDSRPLKSQSFFLTATALDGTPITASSAADGVIDATLVQGNIDTETGIYVVAFGSLSGSVWTPKLIDPSTVRYNAVSYSYLPLDADVIGLDPVRLPQDGRVPIFRKGDFVVLGNTATIGPSSVTNGQVVNCGRTRLSRIRIIGNDGQVINTGWTADLEAGTATINSTAGWSQPVTIEHRIEDMAQLSDVQINGDLSFTRQISHAYPSGSVVSSALLAGDLRARVSVFFDQSTWGGVWSDSINGSPATGTYNDVLAPIEVTNIGATNERFALVFTNTSQFNVIGEHVGQIAVGTTASDCAPINPATGEPYFTIRAVGWGTGWSAGNVLRLNTVGALFPVWVIRTIQQGPETVPEDSFTLLIRGDVDRP